MLLFAQGLLIMSLPSPGGGQIIQVANATEEPIRVQLDHSTTSVRHRRTSHCGAVAAQLPMGMKLEDQASSEVEEELETQTVTPGSAKILAKSFFRVELSWDGDSYLSVTDEHGTDHILGPFPVAHGSSWIVIVDKEGRKGVTPALDSSKPWRDADGCYHGNGCPTCGHRSPKPCSCPEETLLERLWRTIFDPQTCCRSRV